MTHLTMEQLVALRDPGVEPGVGASREHLVACPECQGEFERLEQRAAKLRALPTLKPGRDLFGAVRVVAARERRQRQMKRFAIGGLALAASVTLAVMVAKRPGLQDRQLVAADPELAEMMSQSRQLEQALEGFDQDRSVVDGRAVGITTTLEDRLARIDRQIEVVNLMDPAAREVQMIKLWRERVGLLDALVDVHLTGARYVGF